MIDTATITTKVTELYIGLLGRAPDAPGLQYWVDEISSGKLSLENTRASFATPLQSEYWDIYGGLSNTQLVNTVYNNFLERAPDAAGLEYWVGELDSNKIEVSHFINAVINGVQDTTKPADAERQNDIKVLENKVSAANFFVSQTQNADAHSEEFLASAINAISDVTSDTATIELSKAVTSNYAATIEAVPASNILGVWKTTEHKGDEVNHSIVAFKEDGTYTSTEFSQALMLGEFNGTESGNYQWDSQSGKLIVTATADNNGSTGLSVPGLGSKTLTAQPDGNSLVIASGESFTYQAVKSVATSSDVVGDWYLEEQDNGVNTIQFSILNDGSYTWTEKVADLQPGELNGNEQGYFTWDANSGNFATTTITDYNGKLGLNSSDYSVQIVGSNLQLSLEGDVFVFSAA